MSGAAQPPSSSSIALKITMAASGLFLALWVLAHIIGNLGIFLGRESFNDYAEFMQSLGAAKWANRALLAGALVAHIAAGVTISLRNKLARPEPYAGLRKRATTVAATVMLEGGLLIFAFVLYHLAHLTLGVVHPEHFDLVDGSRPDVYANVVLSFQNPLIAGAYVVSNIAIAAHLSHGVQSGFKSLGLALGRFRRPIELAGPAYAVTILFGSVSIPLACLLGFLTV